VYIYHFPLFLDTEDTQSRDDDALQNSADENPNQESILSQESSQQEREESGKSYKAVVGLFHSCCDYKNTVMLWL